MRIIKRGVGETLAVANNVSVKAEKVQGDTVRMAPGNEATNKPIYRNPVLEELSAAAREALKPPRA